MKLYSNRQPWLYEPWFSKHMEAMTTEGLESKAAIANELAARDRMIEILLLELGLAQVIPDTETLELAQALGH